MSLALCIDRASDVPYPAWTLWRTVFDLDRVAMAIRFYLGDAPEGASRYSPEVEEFPVPG